LRRDSALIWRPGDATEPEASHGPDHVFDVIALISSAAKDLLHEVVVKDHSNESPSGEHRIHIAKPAFRNLPANVAGQQLVPFAHIGLKKTLRQTMIFQSAEKQQTAFRRVAKIAAQYMASDVGEDLERFGIRSQLFFELLFHFVGGTLGAQHFPIEIVFGGKVAEDDSLGDSGHIGYLPRGNAIEAVPREQVGSYFENLLLAIR